MGKLAGSLKSKKFVKTREFSIKIVLERSKFTYILICKTEEEMNPFVTSKRLSPAPKGFANE